MEKTWRAEYKRLYLADQQQKYPLAFAAAGGGTQTVPIPSEGKANGLTQLILKFLRFNGHYANRISTQGQARVHKVPRFNLISGQIQYNSTVQWTKGNTAKGTPDIDAVIYGKAVKIEVKVGKDRMSEAQVQQQTLIESAGGIYFVARDMQSFYEWFNETFRT